MVSNGEGRDFLIDTDIFIWGMERSRKLSPKIKAILEDPGNTIFISVVSAWEIVIKQAKGRLKTPTGIEEGVKKAGFALLSIEISHVLAVAKLPRHHNDPFDRMLIAQAQVENLTLITSDEKMSRYHVSLLKV